MAQTLGIGGGISRLLSSSLFVSSGVYVGSNILNRSIPFLLLPILTRFLSPADFGRIAMFTVGINLAVPLVGICTDSAVGRRYFERDRIDFPNYLTNCLYIFLASTVLVVLLALCFPDWIGSVLGLPSTWVWTIVLVAAARFIASTVLTLWQVQRKAKSYAAYYLLQTVITFGLSIYYVVFLGYG